jgi:hypothetical protein
MFLKNKPYWVKGAIIGAFAYLIILALQILNNTIKLNWLDSIQDENLLISMTGLAGVFFKIFDVFDSPGTYLLLAINPVTGIMQGYNYYARAFVWLANIMIYPIIGALIGILIGKIKTKKK